MNYRVFNIRLTSTSLATSGLFSFSFYPDHKNYKKALCLAVLHYICHSWAYTMPVHLNCFHRFAVLHHFNYISVII